MRQSWGSHRSFHPCQKNGPLTHKSSKASKPSYQRDSSSGSCPKPHRSGPRKCDLGTVQFLETLKVDLVNDICGQMRPVLSVNYVVVLAHFMLLFMQIEEELKNRRNPSWVQAYEGHSAMTREKRLSLTAIALTERNEECMQVMADAFQSPSDGFMDYLCWDSLQTYKA